MTMNMSYEEFKRRNYMENAQRFWMCFVEGAGAPNFRHMSCDEAQKEAARLARKMPGRRVWLLVADTYCVAPEPEVVFSRV